MDTKFIEKIVELEVSNWEQGITPEISEQAVEALEQGKIVFFPNLAFDMSNTEKNTLNPKYINPKIKNISYDLKTNTLRGSEVKEKEQTLLNQFMQRFAVISQTLIERLLPEYQNALQIGRTSLRPVEIRGRKAPSYRKDDTRLHVDAFPSSPVQGRRILRVFSNINPDAKPRVWRIGESFEKVVQSFINKARKPLPIEAKLLRLLKVTKSYRSRYDHYMLQLHNLMKKDMSYQRCVTQITKAFPAGSTWMVYTDQVSHAAMSGQHLLEQSFYLPIDAMVNKEQSPLRVLERACEQALVG